MEREETARRPIGVFDSGIGGISVLRELVALMPNEDYIFFGDSGNAPYGTKTLAEVRKLTLADASHLMEQGAKALVVACNTATSAAVGILRQRYAAVPVIGIEPALKPAVLSGKSPRVLVMATPMTLREEKFLKLMHRFEAQATILPLPCPGLVEFVERGEFAGERLRGFLEALFRDYREEPVDCVVLGCTHYPFVREAIQEVLGEQVKIFDGGAGTARETRRRLAARGLLNPSEQRGTVTFENSAGAEELDMLARRLLGADSNY